MKNEICGWEVENLPLPFRVYRLEKSGRRFLKAAFASLDKAGGWLNAIADANSPEYVMAIFKVFEIKDGGWTDVTAAAVDAGVAGVQRGE